MVKIAIIVLCGAVALLASGASAAGIAGQWRAEFDTQIGTQKYLFTFVQNGEKLAGKAAAEVNGEKREVELQDGRIAGDRRPLGGRHGRL